MKSKTESMLKSFSMHCLLKPTLITVLSATSLCFTFGQAPQQPKAVTTIYKMFGLKEGGCEISVEAPEIVSMEGVSIAAYEEPEQPVVADINSIMGKYTPLFKRSDALVEKYENKQKPATFANGFYLFQSNHLYGLKDAQHKIIIPAKFSQVIPDGKNGFVAYEAQWCNYYSKTGQKLLNKDYYSVKRTEKNTFIVQTSKGCGILLANNTVLVAPEYKEIEGVLQNGFFYYWLEKKDGTGFWLPETGKGAIPVNSRDYITFLNKDYWEVAGSLVNIRTHRKLICESGYYTKILSAKLGLAAIHDRKTEAYYLMDFSGRVISETPFQDLYYWEEYNCITAVVSKGGPSYYSDSQRSGLLNTKGNWMIPAVYKSINFINKKLITVRDEKNKLGVIDFANKVVIPFKYDEINKINGDSILATVFVNNEVKADLISLSKNVVLQSGLPYKDIRSTPLCDSSIYIAEGRSGECFLNSKLEMLGPGWFSRIFYGADNNTILAQNFARDGNSRDSRLFDCSGKVKPLEVNGKLYNEFYEYKQVSPDLMHILVSSDEGYFVSSAGKVTRDDHHWQDIRYSNAKDLFSTMVYGGKFGFINSEGETVIPPVFEYIGVFDELDGLAPYNYDNNQKGFITTDGELLFGTTYMETQRLGLGLFKVKNGDRWGVINREGKVIVPVACNRVALSGGIIRIEADGETIYFDIAGNRI